MPGRADAYDDDALALCGGASRGEVGSNGAGSRATRAEKHSRRLVAPVHVRRGEVRAEPRIGRGRGPPKPALAPLTPGIEAGAVVRRQTAPFCALLDGVERLLFSALKMGAALLATEANTVHVKGKLF